MKNTLYDISLSFANTLDSNIEFKDLCIEVLGDTFEYYVHVDMANVDKVNLPYFSFVTYTYKKQDGEKGEVLVQMLIGIERNPASKQGSIHTEDTQKLLETVAKKAIDLIVKELSVFGINGEKGFVKDYLNVYASPPSGEVDLQLQIDMILTTDRCL